MSNHEFFAERWNEEQPAFVRVLKALPGNKLDYKPHERNTCARDLAWLLAEENRQLIELLDTGKIDFHMDPCPPTIDGIVESYERYGKELKERLERVDSERWNGPGQFIYQGQVAIDGRVRDLCWMYLFDGVHHRGQLSTYIRPMGGKVPSIYGPSGDDPGGM
jgi:uncharacterized damage-inducible protein DinB